MEKISSLEKNTFYSARNGATGWKRENIKEKKVKKKKKGKRKQTIIWIGLIKRTILRRKKKKKKNGRDIKAAHRRDRDNNNTKSLNPFKSFEKFSNRLDASIPRSWAAFERHFVTSLRTEIDPDYISSRDLRNVISPRTVSTWAIMER